MTRMIVFAVVVLVLTAPLLAGAAPARGKLLDHSGDVTALAGEG